MDRNEFKRLERAMDKCDKRRNKQALYEWGIQFEKQIMDATEKAYEEKFKKDLEASVDAFIIAIMYTLHFSEKTKFGPKRCNEIMQDIVATVNMFYDGEYSPEEYKEILAKDKIYLNNIKKVVDASDE